MSFIYANLSVLASTMALVFLYNPFKCAFDKFKFPLLFAVGVIFTATLENFIVFDAVLLYRDSASIGMIALTPIERFVFMACRIISVTVFTSLISRWALHAVNLRSSSQSKAFIVRHFTIGTMIALTFFAWIFTRDDTKAFHIASILLWSLPVLSYLWFVTGTFIFNRKITFAVCVILPSIYFAWIDSIASSGGVWLMDNKLSSGISTLFGLSLERLLFIFVSNAVIVAASFGLDRANAILFIHRKQPLLFGRKSTSWMQFFIELREFGKAFHKNESSFDQSKMDDISSSITFMKKRSILTTIAYSFSSQGADCFW